MIAEAVKAGARKEEACKVVGVPIRTLQDWIHKPMGDLRHQRSTPPANAYSTDELELMLKTLNSAEYRNSSPDQIVPDRLEQGVYLGSESMMYRTLRKAHMLAHRSASRVATSRAPTRRDATGPNQVWSWDITWIRRSDEPGRFFYLYMFVDVWSRYVVGWSIEKSESDALASALVERIAHRLAIDPSGIVLHSDNGRPMRGASMIATLQSLGIIASLSRPSVSNDNPYSESLFKTLKYRPGYPGNFLDSDAARAWVGAFVDWYNDVHLHSALRFMTPSNRHFGRESAVLAIRQTTLELARAARPDRWTGRAVRNCSPIGTVTLHRGVRAHADGVVT
jgi:transposase InsO family protein